METISGPKKPELQLSSGPPKLNQGRSWNIWFGEKVFSCRRVATRVVEDLTAALFMFKVYHDSLNIMRINGPEKEEPGPAFQEPASSDLQKVRVVHGRLAPLACGLQPRAIPELRDSGCPSISFLGLLVERGEPYFSSIEKGGRHSGSRHSCYC